MNQFNKEEGTFHLQRGNGEKVIFPNGQIGEIDEHQRFQAIIIMPKSKREQSSQYDWENVCFDKAVGSWQIAHRQVFVLSEFDLEHELVLVSGSVFSLHHALINSDTPLAQRMNEYSEFSLTPVPHTKYT